MVGKVAHPTIYSTRGEEKVNGFYEKQKFNHNFNFNLSPFWSGNHSAFYVPFSGGEISILLIPPSGLILWEPELFMRVSSLLRNLMLKEIIFLQGN